MGTYTYTYDNNGNILIKEVTPSGQSKTKYSYQYNNGKLVKDGASKTISYDLFGNPTTYRGNSLVWSRGKCLVKFNNIVFNYDGRGRRIYKNGVNYYYDYNDRLIASSNGIQYFYDHIGVAGFKYGGVYYTYKRDIQGNVVGILDNTGTEVVQYVYNAWGEHNVYGSKATTIGALNPFRYRSYFYDTETGLYFLKTRYYDPEIGRFISMDSIDYANPESINGLNLYAYCGNNPVMGYDPDGHSFTGLFIQVFVSLWSYVGIAVVSIFDNKMRQDMKDINWNPFNSDENAIMKSNKVSFYKGVPVINVSNMGGSMTLGAIWFDKSQGEEVLKHERGHSTQFIQLGLVNYLIKIGIPSVWKNDDNTPWELSASILGGSSLVNNATKRALKVAKSYFKIASIPLVGMVNILWYLFY